MKTLIAALAVLTLSSAPALASAYWVCETDPHTGVKGTGTGTSPTQPCWGLDTCPVPSQFLSLSSQASGTFAFDDPDTHTYQLIKYGYVIYETEPYDGACDS